MNYKIIYLICLGSILLGNSFKAKKNELKEPLKLVTADSIYMAGKSIILKFSGDTNSESNLYLSGSYGSVLLKPELKDNLLFFSVPQSFCKKSGIVNWDLINNDQKLNGRFFINPKPTVNTLESYLGPPSIQAGGKDFAMLVVIPTDDLDNPLQENTLVTINTQFQDSEKQEEAFTNDLIAYKNLYSPKQTGRVLVGSESLGTTSKEFDITVLASLPTNFTIAKHGNHNYADGNQITTFYTSQIKDVYGNIVEDGTHVEFFITNDKGSILKASGNTVNGQASAKIIHPDHADNWTIKAKIIGMAESDTLKMGFKQLFDDFEVNFSENNRIIHVGPLKSFMGQLIPDGFNVTISVLKDQKLIDSITKQTDSGEVVFKLNPNIFPKGDYTFEFNTAGLEKIFKSKTLW